MSATAAARHNGRKVANQKLDLTVGLRPPAAQFHVRPTQRGRATEKKYL